MSQRFKVGDKVRCIKAHPPKLLEGHTYTITFIYTGILGEQLVSVVDGSRIAGYCATRFELIEETPKFQAMRIRINSKEHSRAVQAQLFEQGYRWIAGSNRYQGWSVKWLFTTTDGFITYSNDEDVRDCHNRNNPEYKLQVTHSFVKSPETVEVNGKRYNKADYEKAIASLEEVK